MAKQQATTLTPKDLASIAQLPSAQTIGGGINAFNQAAFGNPVAPTSQFGIVPTAPLPPPVMVQPPPAVLPPPVAAPTPTPGVNDVLGSVLHPGHYLAGQGGGFQNAGPRGDRDVLPVGKQAPSAEHQQAILKIFGLDPSYGPAMFPNYIAPTPAVPAKPAAPPPPPPVPATPQHIQSAGQAMGIRDPNASLFGRALHAQGQPPLTVDGLSRIAHAYSTALNGNPANTALAENHAMAHLDVERALAPLGGISPIAHGGAA